MSVKLAKEIRQFIKTRFGLNSRQVSVKTRKMSVSTAVDVTVKKVGLGVDLGVLESEVESFKSVRVCEFSGETLSGGNRFVNVTFDGDEFYELRERFKEACKGFHFGGSIKVGDISVESDCLHPESFDLYRGDERLASAYKLDAVYRLLAEHFGQQTPEGIEEAFEAMDVIPMTFNEIVDRVRTGWWRPGYLRYVAPGHVDEAVLMDIARGKHA